MICADCWCGHLSLVVCGGQRIPAVACVSHARYAAVGATQSVTEREVRSSESMERCFGVNCLAAPIRTIGRRKIPQVDESCSASSFHLYLTHWLDHWKSELARRGRVVSNLVILCGLLGVDGSARHCPGRCVAKAGPSLRHLSSLKCCSRGFRRTQ